MEKMLKNDGNLAVQPGERRVITIAANDKSEAITLRVAAYARVSTASSEQLNSYAAQNRYYTDFITAHTGWKMVDIYADEGISGTSAEKRDDFQRLMADCRRGLIDRVLCKSISRFTRNTKECLEAIRELKSIGVSVFFEEQKIDTGTMSSETITAITASVAQKESATIGSNIQWSYQKRMERGEFLTNTPPYGYQLVDGDLVVDEEQAGVIRQIFQQYLTGHPRKEIAEGLNKAGIPPCYSADQWKVSSIYHILTNERYTGNALLGKTYATDTFPHKRLKNKGERKQYYVANSHLPIISQETFDKTKALLERRMSVESCAPKVHPLQKQIFCGCCGTVFKRQQPRQTEYWICYSRYESKEKCEMPSVSTETIEDAFCRLYYKLKHHGEPILSQMISTHLEIKSRRILWSLDVIELNKRIADLTSQNQLLSMLKQQGLVDSDIFISRGNALAEQIQKAKQEKSRILEAEGDQTVRQTQELIDILAEGPEYIDVFDADLYGSLVDRIIVEDRERISFQLKNGLRLKERIERMKR